MSIRLIDAHLHLQDNRIQARMADLIARAETRGVLRMFCNSTREEDWDQVCALADIYSDITPFIGVHPWFADTPGPGWQQRLSDRLTGWRDCVGVGEIGLDKNSKVDFNKQLKLFETQLEIGLRHGAPISIHCVRSWDVLLALLPRRLEGRARPRIMIHSFNGSPQVMQRLIKLGCHVSYSGAILGRKNSKAIDSLRATPLDALFLETDAPDQLVPEIGRQLELATPHNEPAAVTAIYRAAAHLRGMHLKDFAAHIWNNATIFTN
jgi:TatD DNase family protein